VQVFEFYLLEKLLIDQSNSKQKEETNLKTKEKYDIIKNNLEVIYHEMKKYCLKIENSLKNKIDLKNNLINELNHYNSLLKKVETQKNIFDSVFNEYKDDEKKLKEAYEYLQGIKDENIKLSDKLIKIIENFNKELNESNNFI
jgi:hypothetical protein